MVTWGQGPTMFNPGGFDPVLFANKWLVSIGQNVTKVAGSHTLKMGGYYEWVNNSQPGNDNSNGQLEFATWTGNTTGNLFSDILTGRGINTYNESTKNVVRDMGYKVIEGYAGDSWKVKPRLTIDYGLRALVPRPVVRAQRLRHVDLRAPELQPERVAQRPLGRVVPRARQQRADLGARRAVDRVRVPAWASRGTCRAPARRSSAAATGCSTTTTSRRAPRRWIIPAGHTATTVSGNPLLSDLPSVVPARLEDRPQRDQPG